MTEISPILDDNLESQGLPEAGNSGIRRALVELAQTLVMALVLFGLINLLTARIRVDGHSMEPNFQHNDYVIVSRLSYLTGEIQRGDVVVFPYPNNPDEDYIKRVIGLPGDVIAIHDGALYVNGERVEESYLAEPMRRSYPETVVPEGEVFVMGDNRNDSSDSRRWGGLPIEDILGKAVFVYWPLIDMHVIQSIPPVAYQPQP